MRKGCFYKQNRKGAANSGFPRQMPTAATKSPFMAERTTTKSTQPWNYTDFIFGGGRPDFFFVLRFERAVAQIAAYVGTAD